MQAHHITDFESLSLPIQEDEVDDESLLRTPSVTDSTGGAISEVQARERGRMVKTADQAAQIAFENGLPVTDAIASSLLPTPALGHIRNYDEPVEDYLDRRQKALDGEYRGMPGVSLGVAVRMEMLPTPTTMDTKATNDPEVAQKFLDQGRQTCLTYDISLLPTPIVRDYKDGSAPQERDGKVSTDTVARAIFNSGEIELMGTPRTSSAHSPTQKQIDAGAPKSRLEDPVHTTSWGKFEPAIRRWEQVLGRPAPAPTKPDGKDGTHRLSSSFTEWMMGVPEKWITGCGLTRVEELKACGNGVVPQQAVYALQMLLKGVEL